MYYVLLVPNNNHVTRIQINSPADVFQSNEFTIIGACVERNLIYVGMKDCCGDLEINNNLPSYLLEESVFDEKPPRGPIIIIRTNDTGTPIDIDEVLTLDQC